MSIHYQITNHTLWDDEVEVRVDVVDDSDALLDEQGMPKVLETFDLTFPINTTPEAIDLAIKGKVKQVAGKAPLIVWLDEHRDTSEFVMDSPFDEKAEAEKD